MAIEITSDSVNLLIRDYLKTAGLTHSAFILHGEASLSHESAPPNKLVEILYKALIIEEIEAHSSSPPCESPITLLGHSCLSPPARPSRLLVSQEDAPLFTIEHSNDISCFRFIGAHILAA